MLNVHSSYTIYLQYDSKTAIIIDMIFVPNILAGNLFFLFTNVNAWRNTFGQFDPTVWTNA